MLRDHICALVAQNLLSRFPGFVTLPVAFFIGVWGVDPTGISISISAAVALRAWLRACEAVCWRVMFLKGRGDK